MLEDALDNFFESFLTQETYKLYVDIISYLESIEYDTIQIELMNIMFESIGDEHDRVAKPESQVADEIYGHLRECLLSQHSQQGIEVEEHVTLKDSYDLAVTMLLIGNYEDIGALVACGSLDEPPINQFAEMLQLVSTRSADHWLTILSAVSKDVIKTVLEMSKQTVDSEYQEMEESAEYLQKLRLYAEYTVRSGEKLASLELVANVVLGKSFETYINTGILHDTFEGDEMDKLAKELYCMALMSSDAKNDPVGSIRTIIDKYLEDTRRIVELNAEVTKVNAEFVKFFQTNRQGLTV